MTVDLRWVHGYPLASGRPVARARLRATPADFRVDEVMDVALAGEGEHVWLQVEKTAINTRDVANALGRFASVNPSQVGYSGLKDKHAVCTQWFSVPVPVLTPVDFHGLSLDGCRVLQQQRHQRKLRTATHRQNRFCIRLKELQGKPDAIEQRLQWIRDHGVPNAFGEQRFGYARQNITRMLAWQAEGGRRPGRHVFGLWLSAARSFLFNEVLYRRVMDGSWCTPVSGDLMILDGSRSVFMADLDDVALAGRIKACDIHVSGPLWGESGMTTEGEAAQLEAAALKPYDAVVQFIRRQRAEMHRRPLRVCVPDLQWAWESSDSLRLDFSLPAGCFATAVLRECCLTVEC